MTAANSASTVTVKGDEGTRRSIDEFFLPNGEAIAIGSEQADLVEKQIREDDRGHVFHSWAAQAKINPQPISAAAGAWIFDYQGNGYLDLASQLVSANLGHAHPELVKAIQNQAVRVTNLNPAFANDVRGELATSIIDQAQGDFSHVFFTNGGADAIEHAIRMARLTTGKSKILTAYRSYHGATGSAIMATGEARRHGNPTTDGDIKHFWGPFAYRSAFHSENEEQEVERALQHLEETLVFEDNVAAVLIESMVGSSGVILPPEGYLKGVREICDRHGALWIADEVMVGFGRSGKFFAYEHGGADIQPDLITFAKGVNSGMAPLGGVVMTEQVLNRFADKPYPGGLTYSGHPLACAPGVAAQMVYKRDNIIERVARVGEELIKPRLEQIAAAHPSVGNVRGKGFFWAIEFVADQDTKTPLNAEAKGSEALGAFGAKLKETGLWPMVSGHRLHIAPPLITSEEDLTFALNAIDEAISILDEAL